MHPFSSDPSPISALPCHSVPHSPIPLVNFVDSVQFVEFKELIEFEEVNACSAVKDVQKFSEEAKVKILKLSFCLSSR